LPVLTLGQSRKDLQKNNVRKKTTAEFKYVDGKEIKKFVSVIQYNEKGNEVSRIEYDKKTGKIDKKETYTYNAKGLRTQIIVYNPSNNKVKSTTKYKYNAKGLKTEKTVYNSVGVIKSRKVYFFEYNE